MAGEQLVQVGGRRLRLTNLDKVLYPETGTTKGEVIDYYTRIAPQLIPHASGRPVTRKRWPDGVGTTEHPEQSFFAKDLERGAPAWVPRQAIEHSGGPKEYPLIEDVPTLVYLAQVASLELHVPQWRFTSRGEREQADRLVLDLDPGPGVGLAESAAVARWARTILQGMGMDPVPVTSGSKGIHLYAALPAPQSSDDVSALARELARAIEADHPDLVVSQMAKSARPGRVFIDWSQNNGSKTTIAPYSLRGRAQPTVAVPRTWEELGDPDLRHLRFDEVLQRVADIGDPMAALGFHAGARAADSGPLSAYIAKRTAGKTPEPVPDNPLGAMATPAGERPAFVIQEHHASRLHWDLRLERDGVLASWAVPKGIPATSERNHLAVQTEDHPMLYLDFAGEIPAGQYGAGTMTVWDTGRYDLEKWRDDEIIFTLEGRPGGPLDGRVRLALIRTNGEGEKSSWLLHRMKTDAAIRPGRAPAASVTTGQPAVSAATDPRAVPAATGPVAPMLSTPWPRDRAAEAVRRTAGDDGAAWVEFKWDGVRAIGVWDGQGLRLFARSGTEITDRYPEITGAAAFGDEPVVVDGEMVALDSSGRPSFTRLQNRMHLTRPAEIAAEARRTPVQWYLFDLLARGGTDLTARPLTQRRQLLEEVAADLAAPITVPAVFDDLEATLAAAEEFGLEGVVVKSPRSPYRPGARSEEWLKIKITHTQEVVIGGIRPGKGGRTGAIGSLLLGIPTSEGLHYAGRVGTGFSGRALSDLARMLQPLRSDTDPFVDTPRADASDALWVRPELVGEVEYGEMTPAGILRHSRWRGLRPDLSPADVRPVEA